MGASLVINYSKENFAKKVLEITKDKGVPVVYDGVGKDTFEGSVECLAERGMMVSFGNSSGSVTNIDVKKIIQPKSIYFTRPTMWHYLGTKNELQNGADKLFEILKWAKLKWKYLKNIN